MSAINDPTPERFSKNAAYSILAGVALYAAGYSLRWDLSTYSPASVKLAQRSDAYKLDSATSFIDPVVGIPYISYKTAPTAAETRRSHLPPIQNIKCMLFLIR